MFDCLINDGNRNCNRHGCLYIYIFFSPLLYLNSQWKGKQTQIFVIEQLLLSNRPVGHVSIDSMLSTNRIYIHRREIDPVYQVYNQINSEIERILCVKHIVIGAVRFIAVLFEFQNDSAKVHECYAFQLWTMAKRKKQTGKVEWNTHNSLLFYIYRNGTSILLDNLFLAVLLVNIKHDSISGCSIVTSVHFCVIPRFQADLRWYGYRNSLLLSKIINRMANTIT